MREKMNHPLFYPVEEIKDRKSLFQVLLYGINEGTITAYGDALFDDEFQKPLTKTEAMNEISDWETVYREDDFGNTFADSAQKFVTSYDVKQYWIKEEWFFDRERSVMDVRILGICPVQEKMEEDGLTFKGYKPLFWVYFPEARYVFANFDVFNTFNDAERRTFEDLFWKRIFSSYVRKESNVYNRLVQDYKGTNIDLLLEAEVIKTEIFNFEHDMWHY
jgi:gliding motility associated protien GldN